MLRTASLISDPPANCPATGVLVLANPFSGTGPNRQRVERFTAALGRDGLDVQLVWDSRERRAILSDSAGLSRLRCLVAAGGDGTLADVINDLPPGLVGDGCPPIAILPLGNENLFAQHYGMDVPPEEVARALVAGHTVRVDLGRVGERYFTLMASAGFDADVVHRMAQWRANGTALRRVNRLSYVKRILGTVAHYHYPRVHVQAHAADGSITTAAGSHVFVFNLPRYGGDLDIAPGASPDDALLDWVVFEKPGIMSLVDYAWSVLRTHHLGRPDVPHGRAVSLHLTSQTPAPVQADGDPAGFAPLQIHVVPRALRVIVAVPP
jgi:diacylglycerol kinase family enzyme